MPRKRMTRSEKQEQTRALLLEAASSEIAHKGFGAITIEEIAQLSGLTRGAFYSNFSSKNELFLYLLRRKLGETPKRLQRVNELESRTHSFSPLNADSVNLQDDAESAIVWVEAMLHAWRDADFLNGFATLLVSREPERYGPRNRYKNYARVDAAALAREMVTSIKSLEGDALHININFSVNLDSKQGNGKPSILVNLSVANQN